MIILNNKYLITNQKANLHQCIIFGPSDFRRCPLVNSNPMGIFIDY